MATQRIYMVGTPGEGKRLIKATHRQQALSHVANSMFTIRVATQDDLVESLSNGVQVEQYKAPEQLELEA